MISNLPDNVTDSMIDALCGGDHHKDCLAHEDAEPRYTECGGVGRCECYDVKLWGTRWAWRLWDNWRGWGCGADADPECGCDDIADDEAAGAADAREDLMKEDF